MISRVELFILLNCAAKRAEHVAAIDDLFRRGYLFAHNDGDAITSLTATASGLDALATFTLPANII
jgi:hypothetical protein